MNIPLTTEHFNNAADSLLTQGIQPTPELVAEKLGLSNSESLVDEYLQDWWQGLSKRVILTPGITEAPEALGRAVKLLWEDAVSQAGQLLKAELQDHDVQLMHDTEHQLSSHHQTDYEDLEHRYKQEIDKVEDMVNQLKVVDAEMNVLRSNLTDEITRRKQTEETLLDSRNEVKQGSRNLEDVKRTYDGRIKDVQVRAQDKLAKAEAELSHYRNTLEMIRDQSGKKESALTKNIHDLQTEIAKKEIKIETLIGQGKNTDKELRSMRTDAASFKRQISQLTAQSLTETNRSKRFEELLKQLEIDLRTGQQRLKQAVADALRKESDLRQGLKSKDDELFRIKSSYGALEKRLASQEETVRRLQLQAKAS